jgi:ubiquinone/menaquinone biosynthesis C-methylase UbiE
MSDFILSYWQRQAQKYKDSHFASWGDKFAIELEVKAIIKHIKNKNGNTVLDVGCANGYSSFKIFKLRKLIKLVGIDFSEKMIEEANKVKNKLLIKNNLVFKQDDVRQLNFPNNKFDIVYTTRTLINLPNWDQQLKAICECLRVLKPGGKLIISEAFWEPLQLLNAMRLLKNLSALVEHDFNRYIKKDKLEKFLNSKQLRFKVEDFSSIYYLGTRFLRELVHNESNNINKVKISKKNNFNSSINRIFYDIENVYSGGGFGVQQAYIIYKKSYKI